ncbi:MAG: D-alanyl-D-alanine carboxypeptidase [Candidatus Wildermuthbacteria bacterium]|nr:D-alanyl-D-alanine carboxypeptidase [Candidatus Wildermuthbacteria bacterium]
MTKNTKYFAAAFLLSMPLWVGLNLFSQNLENTFFLSALSSHPEVLAAQTLQGNVTRPRLVSRNTEVPYLNLGTKAAFSLYVDERGRTKVLYAKNQEQPLPIASLTKLMTGYVVSKYFPSEEIIPLAKEAVQKEENTGNFKIGETFFAKDLLYSLLVESSNDAAAAFAQSWGREVFLNAMNEETRNLGLKHTSFADEAGVDPSNPDELPNLASAEDLSMLSKHLLESGPHIFEILAIPSVILRTSENKIHHVVKTTNELLTSNGWPAKVLGGKTGWTPLAQGCLLLILEAPNKNGYIINVILGAEDRFGQMKNLVDWTFKAYEWKSL